MMKKTMKKTAAAVIAAVTVCGLVTGCSAKEEKIEVNASTSSYEDMILSRRALFLKIVNR